MNKALKKKLIDISSSSNKIKLPKIENNKEKNPSPNKQQTQVNPTINTNINNELPNSSKIINKKNKSKKYLFKKNKSTIKITATISASNEQQKQYLAKLEECKERRKKRLELEKKEEERDRKIYEEVLKEFQQKGKTKRKMQFTRINSPKEKNNENNKIQLPKIRVSEKKAHIILEEGGMFDAYKYLLLQLCKLGLPYGNVFDYASYFIKNYEKKWKEKKSQMNKEKFENYWKEKKEQIENSKLLKDNELIKALNRSLEDREINKIIKSLDRSRSSRCYKLFPKFNKKRPENLLIKLNNKFKVSVVQKGGEKKRKNEDSSSKDKSKVSMPLLKIGKEDNYITTIKSMNKTNNTNNSLPIQDNKKENVVNKKK